MRQAHRLLAAGFAASIALSLPVSATTAAIAAPSASVEQSSQEAADYILANLIDGTHLATPGDTADGIIALAAAGGHDETVTAMGEWLKANSAQYTQDNGPAASKVLIALDAACVDHSHLHDAITAGKDGDGNVGAFPSAFNQSLVVMALVRSGQEVPADVLDALRAWQTAPDGGFEYDDFATGEKVYDVDGTAMAAMALDVAGDERNSDRALASLTAHQTSGGYWENFSPVNTTGLVVHALEVDDRDVSAAQTWLVGQQLTDGGFPNVLDGTSSNVMATIQGMQGVAGAGYTDADIDCGGGAPEPEPTPEPEPEPTPEPEPGPIVDTGVAQDTTGAYTAYAVSGLLLLSGGAVAASSLTATRRK